MTMMIGYLRSALVHPDEVLVVEHRLQQAAIAAGAVLEDKDIHREPTPQGNPLWSLMEAMDRRYDTVLTRTVTELAARDRVDLRPLLGGPASFRVLWAAVEQLQGAGGGYLVIPHVGHLDGLVVPRQVLLQRIADVRPAVGILDASNPGHLAPGGDIAVIGEFQVPPVPLAEEIARTNSRLRLTRFGLTDMTASMDRVVRELVSTVTEADHAVGQSHMLTIRIHHDLAANTLVVTCFDTRDYATTPPDRTVIAACGSGQVVRASWGTGGTSTRCELPLPGAHQPEPAAAAIGR